MGFVHFVSSVPLKKLMPSVNFYRYSYRHHTYTHFSDFHSDTHILLVTEEHLFHSKQDSLDDLT